MCDCNPTWICLAGLSRTLSSDGISWPIVKIEIRAKGYIPDVYVRFNVPVESAQLFDDPLVVAHVIAVLRGLGYQGPPFERAELGMQGRNYIVLEPGADFRRFVIDRYRWQDLSAGATAY
jgi:hypothetical protein